MEFEMNKKIETLNGHFKEVYEKRIEGMFDLSPFDKITYPYLLKNTTELIENTEKEYKKLCCKGMLPSLLAHDKYKLIPMTQEMADNWRKEREFNKFLEEKLS